MTVVMSMGMRLVNDPADAHFVKHLLCDFINGCFIAIPAGYIIVPIVEWFTAHIFTHPNDDKDS